MTTTTRDQPIQRLLIGADSDGALLRFAESTLAPVLSAHDSGADLLATLRLLLRTNLNVALVARTQHYHYNTIRYRKESWSVLSDRS